MSMPTNEKFLWVCELTKDEPMKKWVPGNVLEFEDEEDRDYVYNSLIVKTAVLGGNAVDMERNLVSIKTKGFQDKKEIEQPLFSLTLGRNDMISGLDLTVACDHNQEVEFRLTHGTGPVYITCMHMVELPAGEEHPTMMTNSEIEDEECEDISDDVEEAQREASGRGKRVAAMKEANGTNGTNGHLNNGAAKLAAINGKNGEANKEAQQA